MMQRLVVCTPLPQGKGGFPIKFSKRGGGLESMSIFRGGVLGKRGSTFFRCGSSFYIKNKLKSEIFIYKKSL